MNFWKDGFSIDESKSSMLMLLSFLLAVFSMIMYFKNGEIGDNLFSLVNTCLYSIAGVTGIKEIGNATEHIFENKNNDIGI